MPEAIACQSIVQWLEQNCRAFEYSESAIDRTQLRFFGFDMVAVGYEVGLAAQSYRYRHNRPLDYWRVGACLEEGGWPSRWEHVVASCAASSFPFDPPEYSEGKIVTKAEQVRRMPKELTALTWGCRRPIWKGSTANPCGRCRTCIARGELGLA